MTTRLAGTDSLFLSMETPEVHGHVGALLLLDPSDAPGFDFERLTQTLAERLTLAGPEFTAILKEDPLGLAGPHLVPVASLDVAQHVHRVAVPSPGGMPELAELCGFLFERKLDRRRPLWETWFIEGLEGGRVAVLMKTHHALMDGMKGAGLSTVLCDLVPDPPAAPIAAPATEAPPPSAATLLLEGLANLTALPTRLTRYGMQVARRGLNLIPHVVEHGLEGFPGSVPRLSFNGEIGAGRRFAYASVPLAAIKTIKEELGVKLNDVVVELCGTAMKRYTQAIGEEACEPLAVGCPVSTRTSEGGNSNQLATMTVACASDLADPVDRVRAIHSNADQAKRITHLARSTPIAPIGDVLPPLFINLGFRALLRLSDLGVLPVNAVVSNVPGPPVPLYMAGARVEAMYPISILTRSQGLNFTVFSFMDRLDIGLTVDPALVREPWLLAACIDDAFEELCDAVERRTGSHPTATQQCSREASAPRTAARAAAKASPARGTEKERTSAAA